MFNDNWYSDQQLGDLINLVKKVKEEYDLFLFDDLIDHSYDNEPDDSKRFNMVFNELNRLKSVQKALV